MKRIKKRIFSGTICEQLVFNVSDKTRKIKEAKPRLRFKTQEEREQHKLQISRRRHARLINENMDAVEVVRCKDCEVHNNCTIEEELLAAGCNNPFCPCGGRKDK